MTKNIKSYFIIVITAIFQFSYIFVMEIVGATVSGSFLGTAFEFLIGIGYIASIVFGIMEDFEDGGYRHLSIVLLVGILLKVLMMLFVKIGIAILGASVVLMFVLAAKGPAVCYCYMKIFDLVGISGKVLVVACIVALVVASATVFG